MEMSTHIKNLKMSVHWIIEKDFIRYDVKREFRAKENNKHRKKHGTGKDIRDS